MHSLVFRSGSLKRCEQIDASAWIAIHSVLTLRHEVSKQIYFLWNNKLVVRLFGIVWSRQPRRWEFFAFSFIIINFGCSSAWFEFNWKHHYHFHFQSTRPNRMGDIWIFSSSGGKSSTTLRSSGVVVDDGHRLDKINKWRKLWFKFSCFVEHFHFDSCHCHQLLPTFSQIHSKSTMRRQHSSEQWYRPQIHRKMLSAWRRLSRIFHFHFKVDFPLFVRWMNFTVERWVVPFLGGNWCEIDVIDNFDWNNYQVSRPLKRMLGTYCGVYICMRFCAVCTAIIWLILYHLNDYNWVNGVVGNVKFYDWTATVTVKSALGNDV